MENPLTVGKAFGKAAEIRSYKEDAQWVLPSCMVGVELELEGIAPTFKFSGSNYWEVKEDGSLRDINDGETSKELVFSVPLCGYDLTKALSILKHTLDKQKKKPVTSPRCSTHIHIDVRELTFNKLLNFLVLYTIVERPLYHYCGNSRENNNFCLPFYKAEGAIFSHISSKDMLSGANELVASVLSNKRYSGLNICALKLFGSVEFRHLPGTVDVDKITQWINILMCIKKAAIEYNGQLQLIPKTFSEKGIENNVKEIFKNYYQYITYPELEYDVLQGIRQAQDILYETTDNEQLYSKCFLEKSASCSTHVNNVVSKLKLNVKKK